MLFTDDQIRALPGAGVYDTDQAPIGTVEQVWADTAGQPSWVSVRSGLPDAGETLLPMSGARFTDHRLYTPYRRDQVLRAPGLTIDDQQPLNSKGLQTLCAHYGLSLDTEVAASAADATASVVRSEEHLAVRKEQEVIGRVRLRKHIVTEYVTVTVPIRREEVRLEQVPLTEAYREGVDIGDDDREIILHAERPVVTTETIAVERVRFGKQTAVAQQTVSGRVSKERVEVDLPDDLPSR